jgi:Tol biopolymer transport system component
MPLAPAHLYAAFVACGAVTSFPHHSTTAGGIQKMVLIGRPRSVAVVAVAGALVAVGLLVLMVEARPAEATFPGKNGKIAYVDWDGHDLEIYTINPNGGGKTKVTNNNSYEDEPSFSPNGRRIAYSGYDGNDYEIYTINVGGGGKIKVTNNNTDDFSPSYSPDGKKIAYQGYEGNDPNIYTDGEIFTINVSGGDRFQVTNNDNSDNMFPDYSPDGTRIAYTGLDGNDNEIYTINVGGGGKSQVTHNDKDEEAPSYSPDGKKIAYTGYNGAGYDDIDFVLEIYTINIGGGDKSQVTDSKSYASQPSWGSRP